MQGNTLVQLLQPFALICVLRYRPQQLPVSPFLLGLTLGAYALSSIIALLALGIAPAPALLAGPIAATVIAALTTGLLYLRNLRERTVQTLTALCGSGVVLNIIAFPLALSLRPSDTGIATNQIAAITLSLLMLWSFAVTAHVLRHALSASFLMGLAYAIVFHLASDFLLEVFIDFDAGRQ